MLMLQVFIPTAHHRLRVGIPPIAQVAHFAAQPQNGPTKAYFTDISNRRNSGRSNTRPA
jgi:hypothetical protein